VARRGERWKAHLSTLLTLFLAGGMSGSLFYRDALKLLTDPWVVPGAIYGCFSPHPAYHLVTPQFCWFIATAGSIAALPAAALLLWDLVALRPCPRGALAIVLFFASYYATISFGVSWTYLLALPRIVETIQEHPFFFPPSTWVEVELCAILEIAALMQIAVVAITALLLYIARRLRAALLARQAA